MGLVPAELKDADIIIGKLQERCNAGRNCHVWRQKFSSRVQRDTESADSWLSDLRDLARKCEFEKDCCAACQNTRILGQVVFGVFDDEVRRKLLELGATLTLDMALTMLRTAEATRLQASTIKQGGAAPVHQLKTPAAKPALLTRLCFSSATRLCRAELHHHKLFSTAQRAISFPHTGVHSLRNGSKPLSYWKSGLNMQRSFKFSTSTVPRTPSHRWRLATAWSSKTTR